MQNFLFCETIVISLQAGNAICSTSETTTMARVRYKTSHVLCAHATVVRYQTGSDSPG